MRGRGRCELLPRGRGRCDSFYQEGEVGVVASTKRAR